MSNTTSVALMNTLTSLLSRFYEKAEESKLPDILKDCMALFRSEAMFLLLSNFTGLKLHFLAPSEGELEDKKEGEAASAADDTEEGPSRSSEPESRRAAISSSSQQSNEQTDPEPEENDAKKGKLLLRSVLLLLLGIHDSVIYSLNKHFLSTCYMLGPISGAGEEDRQGLCSPWLILLIVGEDRDEMIHEQQENIK